MDTTKSIFASRTVWGIVVSVIAGLVGIFSKGKVQLGDADQDQIVTLILEAVSVLGGLFAVYGRMKAQTSVTLTGSPS